MRTILNDTTPTASTSRKGVIGFIRTYHIAIIIALGFLLVWSLIPLRAPYSLRYQIKKRTQQATFICGDGVYSFAKTRSGACSGHGGITDELSPDDEYEEDPNKEDPNPKYGF